MSEPATDTAPRAALTSTPKKKDPAAPDEPLKLKQRVATTADVSGKGWHAPILRSIQRVAPDLSAEMSKDDITITNSTHGGSVHRLLNLRIDAAGQKFTGIGVLPQGVLRDDTPANREAVDVAVRAAFANIEELVQDARGRAGRTRELGNELRDLRKANTDMAKQLEEMRELVMSLKQTEIRAESKVNARDAEPVEEPHASDEQEEASPEPAKYTGAKRRGGRRSSK